MIDLSPLFPEATNNMRNWKNRYSAQEFPYKVALNIFYRRYTMMYMWPEIMAYANGQKGRKDFQTAYRELEQLYAQTAMMKTRSILEANLANRPNEDVGGCTFAHYNELIDRSRRGDKAAKEEIEFSYFYYFLADKATLLWAAVCASGVDKVKAIQEVSGFIIEPMPLNDYATVSQGLGQLAAAPFMQRNYTPLP